MYSRRWSGGPCFLPVSAAICGHANVPVSRLIKEGMIGSCLVILLWTLIMHWLFRRRWVLRFFLRGSLTLLSLLPLGLAMGIPLRRAFAI